MNNNDKILKANRLALRLYTLSAAIVIFLIFFLDSLQPITLLFPLFFAIYLFVQKNSVDCEQDEDYNEYQDEDRDNKY